MVENNEPCVFCGRTGHGPVANRAECKLWKGPNKYGNYYKDWGSPAKKAANYTGMVVSGTIFVAIVLIVIFVLATAAEELGL